MEPLPRGKGRKDKVCVRKGHLRKLHISAWREGMHRLTSGVWVLTHRAWPTNKKNWKSMHSQSVLKSWGSQRLSGTESVTGRVSWRLYGENGEEWQWHFLTKHLLVYAEVQCETRDLSDRKPLVKSKGKRNMSHAAWPVTSHLFKGTMNWIMLYTNNDQKQLNYQTWSSLEPHGIVQAIQGISRSDGW